MPVENDQLWFDYPVTDFIIYNDMNRRSSGRSGFFPISPSNVYLEKIDILYPWRKAEYLFLLHNLKRWAVKIKGFFYGTVCLWQRTLTWWHIWPTTQQQQDANELLQKCFFSQCLCSSASVILRILTEFTRAVCRQRSLWNTASLHWPRFLNNALTDNNNEYGKVIQSDKVQNMSWWILV